MNSYDLDRSLHTADPPLPLLDDGFSPPRSHGEQADPPLPATGPSLEEALAAKSDF